MLVLTFLSISALAQEEDCNWGFVGPKQFQCNGQVYIYGSAICQSVFFSDLFCHKSLSRSAFTCSKDQSLETKKCRQVMLESRRNDFPGDWQNRCEWVPQSQKSFYCNGQGYILGSVRCQSATFPSVFCRSDLSRSPKQCIDDQSPGTIECYYRLIQDPRPYGPGTPLPGSSAPRTAPIPGSAPGGVR